MNPPFQILIVDDQMDNVQLLVKMLTPEGYGLRVAGGGRDALRQLEGMPIDLVLLDVMMPDLDGLEVCRQIKQHPEIRYVQVLLVTAKTDLPSVVTGLDAGANDYLTKPIDRRELLARVRAALRARKLEQTLRQATLELEEKHRELEASYRELSERTLEKERLQEEVGDLRRLVSGTGRLRQLAGRSEAMQQVFEQIQLVARGTTTVLIRGETGTGKELVARAIHEESGRASAPFLALNCGAVPDALLESELFGHEKGAFTGALTRKAGRFERAAGGTLFLDEIGDLPKLMQVKLLRILQEKVFERVGGAQLIAADVRIIAATHKDLEAMVASGEFRQDLYYRLNVFPIELPALRDRRDDIPLLANNLLTKLADSHGLPSPELTPEALQRLAILTWPGNVRELENTLERALILSRGHPILDRHLPALDASFRSSERAALAQTPETFAPHHHLPFKEWKQKLLEHYERAYIVSALVRFGGNMTVAARETGVDAKTFSRKIAEYHIKRREFMSSDEP